MIDTGKENAEFQAVDIYYRDTQTGSVYVDPDDFEKNTTLKKASSSDTYQLSETKQLKGVYNINRGYAVFVRYRFYAKAMITILYKVEMIMVCPIMTTLH